MDELMVGLLVILLIGVFFGMGAAIFSPQYTCEIVGVDADLLMEDRDLCQFEVQVDDTTCVVTKTDEGLVFVCP